jgi:hypothetical protein
MWEVELLGGALVLAVLGLLTRSSLPIGLAVAALAATLLIQQLGRDTGLDRSGGSSALRAPPNAAPASVAAEEDPDDAAVSPADPHPAPSASSPPSPSASSPPSPSPSPADARFDVRAQRRALRDRQFSTLGLDVGPQPVAARARLLEGMYAELQESSIRTDRFLGPV